MTIRRHVLIPLVVVLTLMVVVLASVSVSIAETPKRISVVYSKDLIPFHFQNKDGQPDGMIIDHWKLWSQKTGIEIEFIPAAWDQTLNMMRQGQADAHAGLFFNAERDKFLLYGVPLRKLDTHMFYHKGLPAPESNQDFKPYRIGVLSGDFVEGYLKKHLPGATIKGYTSYESLMEALHRGDIKVFAADTPAALYYLQESNLASTFRYRSDMPLYQNDLFIAVREGNSDLVQLINEGMHKITDLEKQMIARKWASVKPTGDTSALIVAINRDYPPFAFMGPEGDPTGLIVELWRLWSQTTGTPIRFRPSSWAETLEALRKGEADIHFGLFKNKERSQWMDFSEPIHRVATGFYFHTKKDAPTTPAKLKDQKVGVLRGSYQENYLKTNYPDTIVVSHKDNEDLVLSLLRGETKALVDEIPVVEAELNRLGMPGALVRSKDILFSNFMYAGVLKGNSALLKKINDGFAAISYDQLAAIEARWIPQNTDRFYKKETDPSKLTREEQNWLEQHQVIRIGNELDWPPFDFVEDGEPSGYSIDIVRLMAQKLGIAVKFVNGYSWNELVKMFEQGKLDVLPCIYDTEERRKTMAFTKEYATNPSILIVKESSTDISELKDLLDRKVAAIEGFATTKALEDRYPRIQRILVRNALEGLQKVSFGEADAYIGSLGVVSYVMQQNFIPDIKIVGEARLKTPVELKLHMAVPKEKKILRDILQKGLDAITADELQEIRKRWMPISITALKPDEMIELTDAERKWLAQHPDIRLGDDFDRPPFAFEDDEGNFSGISSSYIETISERLGIKIQPVKGLTWTEVVEQVKSGGVDILPAIVRTAKREKFLNFTRPFISLPIVMATVKEGPFIDSLSDLKGLRVGVVKGHFTHDLLASKHPQLTLVTFENPEDGLRALDNEKLDAFVDNLGSITYQIGKHQFENIKIVAPTAYRYELSIGVRKDWPELAKLLDKALDTVDDKERTAIKNTWMAVEVTLGMDIRTILTWAVPVGLGVVMIIIVIFFWNRRLAGEVAERKQKEKLIKLGAQISQSLTLGGTLKETLQSITDIFVKELNVAFARIWIVDETENVLKLQASSGLHTHIEGDHERILIGGDTKIGRVVFEQKPHMSNNIQDSPYVKDKDWAKEQGLTAFAGIPMVVEGRSVGALVAFSKEPISEDIINTILSIADSIAVAIERTRAQEIVRESEENYRLLVKNLPSVVYRGFADWSAEFYDNKIELLTGYKMEEYNSGELKWSTLVVDEDYEYVKEKFIEALKTDKSYIREYRIKTKAGDILWLQERGFIICDDSGEMEYIDGVFFDITERKQMEEELVKAKVAAEEASKKIIAMSDSSLDALIMIDEKANINFWNPAAEDVFGYSAEEVMGRNLHELVVPQEDRDLALKGVETFAQTGEGPVIGVVIERNGLRKDGSIFPAEIAVSALQMDDQWFAVGTVRDITERKKAEDALKASEKRVQMILNSINTGVIIIDPENRTIVDVNPVAAQMIGLPREKIIGHICHQFICPKAENDCPVLDNDQEIDNAERVLVTAAGQEVPILKTVTSVDLGGKPHLLESFIDITERKQAEEELQQHLQDLKKFEKMAIGREERMIELKEQINQLLKEMGQEAKYKIV